MSSASSKPKTATTLSPIESSTIKSSGSKQQWGGLYGSAAALAIINAVEKSHTALIITPDTSSANHLLEELRFFSDTLPTYHFTDWETLHYDTFSPHDDIISSRLETLYRMSHSETGIIVTSISTFCLLYTSPSPRDRG